MAVRGRKETLFLPYRTTNTVIEYEPDRRIAWQTYGVGGLAGGRTWRDELAPTDGGTLVRETWGCVAGEDEGNGHQRFDATANR